MSVLDSTVGLIYSLKADDSDARKSVSELREHIDKESDKIEESSSNALLSLGKSIGLTDQQIVSLGKSLPIIGAVAGGIAAIGGAAVGVAVKLFDLSKQTSEAGTEIKNFSTLTGLTAESISTIKAASESAGVSLENFEEVWESFIETLVEGGQGAEDAAAKLKKAGIDPQQGFKDLEGSVKKAFDAIRNAQTQAEKSAIAMAVFGESGLNMVKVADEMTGGFDQFKQKLTEMGVVFDRDGVQKSKEFDKNLKLLQMQAEGVTRTFALEFMPVFTDGMSDLSKYFSENKEVVKEWGAFTRNVLRGVRAAVESDIGAAIYKFTEFFTKYAALGLVVKGLEKLGENQSPRASIEGDSTGLGDNKTIDAERNKTLFEKQKQESDKRLKERIESEKKDIAARIALYRNQLAEIENEYGESYKRISENFKEDGLSKVFENDLASIQRKYRVEILSVINNLEGLQKLLSEFEKKTPNETKLLENEQAATRKALLDKFNVDREEAKKLLIEKAKTEAAETNKITEESVNHRIVLKKKGYETEIADLDRKLQREEISESQHATLVAEIRIKSLEFERTQLQKLYDSEQTTAEKRTELYRQLQILDEEVKQQRIENSIAIAEAVKAETDALHQRNEAAAGGQDEGEQASGSAGESGGGFLGSLVGSMFGNLDDITAKVDVWKGIGETLSSYRDWLAITPYLVSGGAAFDFTNYPNIDLSAVSNPAPLKVYDNVFSHTSDVELLFDGLDDAKRYRVILHFCEGGATNRVMDVTVDTGIGGGGDDFLQEANLNVYTRVGLKKAMQLSCVADGTDEISIRLEKVTNNPMISAVEIIEIVEPQFDEVFNVLGLIPFHYKDERPKWEEITNKHLYQDKSTSFNTVNTKARRRWIYHYDNLTKAQAAVFDEHYDEAKLDKDFGFTDRNGYVYDSGIFYESYEDEHEGNNRQIQERKIVLCQYP